MEKRDQFLLHLYDQLWNSITRIEQGLWQFIGIYAGIFGAHLYIGKSQPMLAVILTILAAFWGINIAINAGKWFERNRMLIINIEMQFLSEEDSRKIMPSEYRQKKPRKFFTVLDRIHILVFFTSVMISLITYWNNISRISRNVWIVVVLLTASVVLTAIHWISANKEMENAAKCC